MPNALVHLIWVLTLAECHGRDFWTISKQYKTQHLPSRSMQLISPVCHSTQAHVCTYTCTHAESHFHWKSMSRTESINTKVLSRGSLLSSSAVKNPPAMQEMWFDPWVGKIPWRRKWQPTPVFLPGKCHGQRSLVGYSPWGCKESDMT